jgi:hypothetical protein
MINYKLIENSNFVRKIENGVETNEFLNAENNPEYLEWLEEGNTPLPPYTEEELSERNKQNRIAELKKLLFDSDYKMNTDYFNSMTKKDQDDWTQKRKDWREEIRNLSI